MQIGIVMMLFVLKRFSKPEEKLSTEQIYLEISLYLYLAIYFKYWLTTLANLITFKAHDSSKAFNNLVVVTIKRNLWIRAIWL